VLYAPYPDKSLLRDVLAYELYNQMAITPPAPASWSVSQPQHNRLSSAHYVGVYVLRRK